VFSRQTRHRRGITALALIGTVMVAGCAGGVLGEKEQKLAYFHILETDTLARLIKEQPKTEQELAQSVGYAVGEKKVVKVPLVGAGGGALTDAGVSATATISVLRTQPYSID